MASKKTSSSSSGSTQSFLAIKDVREDFIITPDGGLRAVVAVSSTNFVLKSQQEQDAILARYQSFLNSLEFPIQILMQSRKLDIHGYLLKIQERLSEQTNELLRLQTEEYIEYVKKLLEIGNIMNKSFYVVVPFNSTDSVKSGLVDRFKSFINPGQTVSMSNQRLQQGSEVINDRVGRVMAELSAIGLRTVRLKTQELVELLYDSYNIGSEQVGMVELDQLNLTKQQ